ncbi:hypothetical protein E2C01_041170 [Portunus trituberculatus]|uniref:Uncharacterized protein n=1 Tax=Portunus trituberculatus TaxID=210409 RepID=A0A5B7FPN4_PORTR|nr:hypothetical protein [Portunus trituberculatus]
MEWKGGQRVIPTFHHRNNCSLKRQPRDRREFIIEDNIYRSCGDKTGQVSSNGYRTFPRLLASYLTAISPEVGATLRSHLRLSECL